MRRPHPLLLFFSLYFFLFVSPPPNIPFSFISNPFLPPLHISPSLSFHISSCFVSLFIFFFPHLFCIEHSFGSFSSGLLFLRLTRSFHQYFPCFLDGAVDKKTPFGVCLTWACAGKERKEGEGKRRMRYGVGAAARKRRNRDRNYARKLRRK